MKFHDKNCDYQMNERVLYCQIMYEKKEMGKENNK